MHEMKIALVMMAASCLSLLTSHSHAQESRIATQSTRCAAIYSVFAETTADNPERQKRFLNAATIFSELFVKEHSNKKDLATLEEAHRRRDLVLEEFRNTYASQRAYLIEESVLCGAWGEGFLVQGESYSFVPVIPKVIPQNVRSEYEATAAAAFDRWVQ